METVHVKIGEKELAALRLLAVKDRRRPAELVRFAVEDYIAARREEVEALQNQHEVDKKD